MTKIDVAVEVEPAKVEESFETEKLSFLTKFRNFYMRNYLPFGMVISIFIGILLPQPAVWLNERIPLITICVVILFFSIGIRMRFVEAKSAVQSYKEVAVGLFLVLFLGPVINTTVLNHVPYFGSFLGADLSNSSNHSSGEMELLGPEEFRLSLQIYFIVPAASASCLIMVTAANGHRGLSILVSIMCVFISIFTIPPMMVWLSPALQDVNINVGEILLKTGLRVLLPLVIGRMLRCLAQVKKVVQRWNNSIKYFGISFLFGIFLVKVSETSANGNLGKVSVVNIVCVVAMGTSLATMNMVASYGLLSVLPWFSKKTAVTLPVLTCIRSLGLAATVVDVLPENIGDKGLATLPMVFIHLAALLVLNVFVLLAKVKEDDTKTDEPEAAVEEPQIKDREDSRINSKINEVAVFSIYTDEMSTK